VRLEWDYRPGNSRPGARWGIWPHPVLYIEEENMKKKITEMESCWDRDEWISNVLRIVGPSLEHRLRTDSKYRERLKRVIGHIEQHEEVQA